MGSTPSHSRQIGVISREAIHAGGLSVGPTHSPPGNSLTRFFTKNKSAPVRLEALLAFWSISLSCGAAHGLLEHNQRATEDYDKAIQLDPDYAEAYYNRGRTYYILGQYTKADADEAKACSVWWYHDMDEAKAWSVTVDKAWLCWPTLSLLPSEDGWCDYILPIAFSSHYQPYKWLEKLLTFR